ncbi:MAG: hypothetical protein PHF46_04435 [Candidatus Gracilibacteria bacterium]|nr:hypothetical protein [Candidatus Gracilibacteria bacterium]
MLKVLPKNIFSVREFISDANVRSMVTYKGEIIFIRNARKGGGFYVIPESKFTDLEMDNYDNDMEITSALMRLVESTEFVKMNKMTEKIAKKGLLINPNV